MRTKIALYIGVFVSTLIVVSISVTLAKVRGGDAANDSHQHQGVHRTSPLLDTHGTALVEIRDLSVDSPSPNIVSAVNFKVVNLSNKQITAIVIALTYHTENNGVSSGITEYQTTVAYPHPDLQADSFGRPLTPKEERQISERRATRWEAAQFKYLDARVEYIVFDDQTSSGPDRNGTASSIISLLRSGAEKYKQWARSEFAKVGHSSDEFQKIVQSVTLPDNLVLASAYEKSGAHAYRSWLLKCYKSGRGSEVVLKYLS